MMSPRRCSLFAAAFLAALLLTPLPAQEATESADARVARLLEAMGGRAAWAGVGFVQVEATHDNLTIAEPVANKIFNDLKSPRVRFEGKNSQIDSTRAIAGGAGWRSRGGQVSPLTSEEFESESRWWEANIYRTLRRLALGDPELTARAVGAHRLEIFRTDGTRLNWFVMNMRGEPMVFGSWDAETGMAFGPLASNGTVRYARWGAAPNGSFRYEIVRFVTAPSVPDDISFNEP
ncbi:MAG TPA: hypothetical protein VIK52_08915 [Opitutaceae bacterium]